MKLDFQELVEKYSDKRKIVITTHHVGFFSILSNWLTKGEKSGSYKEITDSFILNKEKTGFFSKPICSKTYPNCPTPKNEARFSRTCLTKTKW
jgi:hypothetical protein